MNSTVKSLLVNIFLLPVLAGILLLLAWPNMGVFPLLFIGLIPLFFVVEQFSKLDLKYRLLGVFSFLIFHIVWLSYSVRWFHDSSPKSYWVGIIFSGLILVLFMIPVLAFSSNIKQVKLRALFFVSAWMTMEYFNQQWMVSTPYFSLGSGFGMSPKIIQHFEFIGVEGGSLWVLISNLVFFLTIQNWKNTKKRKNNLILAFSIVLIPILISASVMYRPRMESGDKKLNVAVLHSYFDPHLKIYNDSPNVIVSKLFTKSAKFLDQNTDILIWPEVALANVGWLNNSMNEVFFSELKVRAKKFPNLNYCIGGIGFTLYKMGQDDSYARVIADKSYKYQTHNVALSISNDGKFQIRSKKNFVPFQERIPFIKTFPFFKKFADYVGSNIMFSYYDFGVNEHALNSGIRYAPLLCYESIYPLFMSEMALDSDFFIVMANEYWNNNMDGSEQYLHNNIAMAIQNRKYILRSSNNGVSAIIDPYGNILKSVEGKNETVIKESLSIELNKSTLYASIQGVFYYLSIFGFSLFSIISLLLRSKKQTS